MTCAINVVSCNCVGHAQRVTGHDVCRFVHRNFGRCPSVAVSAGNNLCNKEEAIYCLYVGKPCCKDIK